MLLLQTSRSLVGTELQLIHLSNSEIARSIDNLHSSCAKSAVPIVIGTVLNGHQCRLG